MFYASEVSVQYGRLFQFSVFLVREMFSYNQLPGPGFRAHGKIKKALGGFKGNHPIIVTVYPMHDQPGNPARSKLLQQSMALQGQTRTHLFPANPMAIKWLNRDISFLY